jgi:hypothetical protein
MVRFVVTADDRPGIVPVIDILAWIPPLPTPAPEDRRREVFTGWYGDLPVIALTVPLVARFGFPELFIGTSTTRKGGDNNRKVGYVRR